MTDGLFYKKTWPDGSPAIPRHRLQLLAEANTFCGLKGAALHFEEMPLSDGSSQLALTRNLFVQTAKLVQVDANLDLTLGKKVFPDPADAKIISCCGGFMVTVDR